VIGPDELHELLHAQVESIEPNPHLAELGSALTVVERHRRTRVFVGTTIVVVVVAAAVTVVRTIETRPTRFDTAPVTQRVVVLPDPRVLTSTTAPIAGGAVDPAPPSTPVAPVTGVAPATVPGGAPVATPSQPAPAATTPPKIPAPQRVLTFRAASVSDLSSADPPSADYFGVAPTGTTVTATSSYGTASTQAGPDTRWSLHLVLPNAPVGQRVKVVLSAPPLPSLTFTFTHTAG